ncbi:MAG: hypothetical protein FJ087_19445, partial [Deltaproteobacteria bacterium]|nr:hypothetical protein [Deltaproteobacteria bacterium]
MLDRVPGRIVVEVEPADAVVTVDESEVPRRDGAATAPRWRRDGVAAAELRRGRRGAPGPPRCVAAAEVRRGRRGAPGPPRCVAAAEVRRGRRGASRPP